MHLLFLGSCGHAGRFGRSVAVQDRRLPACFESAMENSMASHHFEPWNIFDIFHDFSIICQTPLQNPTFLVFVRLNLGFD